MIVTPEGTTTHGVDGSTASTNMRISTAQTAPKTAMAGTAQKIRLETRPSEEPPATAAACSRPHDWAHPIRVLTGNEARIKK